MLPSMVGLDLVAASREGARRFAYAPEEAPLDELIAQLSQSVGIDPATARTAVGIILNFLKKEGPPAEVDQLVDALPGAEGAMADTADAGGGGLMGMMGGGGGVMALGGQLMGAGLSMGQIQTLAKELFAHGRAKAGEDVMGPIVGSIPGLSQFV
jgi:hypothetical protein